MLIIGYMSGGSLADIIYGVYVNIVKFLILWVHFRKLATLIIWQWKLHFLWVLYLICKMTFKVNYFAGGGSKKLICMQSFYRSIDNPFLLVCRILHNLIKNIIYNIIL